MAKKQFPPQDKIELYEKLIATHPEIERKGATMPYTSLNGNMYSFLDKEGFMGLRLGKEEREAFMEKYSTGLSVQYGAVMKEYVKVPSDLLNNTAKMSKYLSISHDYVKTLKPKPTKKK